MSNENNYDERPVLPDGLKLTKWKNEPTVRDLAQDYEDARTDHNHQTEKIQRWKDNLNVEGTAARKKRPGRSNVQPKLIRKQAEWRYPALSEPFLSTKDLFNVLAVSAEDKERALQNQMVLNHQFNTKLNKITFINRYVRNCVDTGTVICRVGWEYEEEVTEREEPIYEYFPDETAGQLLQEIMQLREQSPSEFNDLETPLKESLKLTEEYGVPYNYMDTGETETIEDVKVIKNHPTVKVCDPMNTTIDPSCGDNIDNARFVIHQFDTSLAELREAGIYQNLEYVDPEKTNILSQPDATFAGNKTFNFNDEPRKRFVAYEYWGYRDVNGDGTLVPIVATYVGDVMIRMQENPFPDKRPPFIAVPYLPEEDSVYGIPDGELLKDNQDIVGAVTRGMIDLLGRSANGQRAIRKGALGVTDRRKMERGDDYEYNAEGNTHPENIIHMHKFPEIPRAAEYILEQQNADAESMSGIKAFTGGISGQALGNTATGIRSALDATSKRELDILRRLSKGIVDIGRKIISMNAVFLDEIEVVRITNEKFVEIRRDDLAGNFDLELSISTAEADNQKAEELVFMLQTTGNNMDPEMQKIILSDIARLRNMPDLAERITNHQPEPDPMQQQLAQLQIAKLQAEIEEIKSRTVENYAEAKNEQAKTVTEMAKARNLNSDSDQKDLNFIQEESGTNQARQLQSLEKQATSNMQQEVLKSNLNKQEESPAETKDTRTTNGLTSI